MIDIPKVPTIDQRYILAVSITKELLKTCLRNGNYGCMHGFVFNKKNDYGQAPNRKVLTDEVLNLVNIIFLFFGHYYRGELSNRSFTEFGETKNPHKSRRIIRKHLHKYGRNLLK